MSEPPRENWAPGMQDIFALNLPIPAKKNSFNLPEMLYLRLVVYLTVCQTTNSKKENSTALSPERRVLPLPATCKNVSTLQASRSPLNNGACFIIYGRRMARANRSCAAPPTGISQ